MSFRSDLRESLRTALEAVPPLQGVERLDAFPREINPESCPFYVIRTPTERVRDDDLDTFERVTDVVVHIRRMGAADLEDQLDEDAGPLEKLVVDVLDTVGQDGSLVRLDVDVEEAGGSYFGKLDMLFQVTRVTGDFT